MNAGAVLVVPAYEPGRGARNSTQTGERVFSNSDRMACPPINAAVRVKVTGGGGHLIRCMALVNGLRELGRDSWLFLPALADESGVIDTMRFDRNRFMGESGLLNIRWECIVLDRFQTPPEELDRWMQLAPVIGIDEGGPSRNSFDFLIDILPGCHRIRANIADPSLLPLPQKSCPQDNTPAVPLKVLISFGQEDAAGLGFAAARALIARNSDGMEITLLQGGLNSLIPDSRSLFPSPQSPVLSPHSLKIIKTIPNLNKHLHEYDLLITHYGLTAFEALYAGVPVVLVSPGAYHEKLAKKAGFYSLGIGKNKAKKLKRLLFSKGDINRPFLHKLKNHCAALAAKYNLEYAPWRSLAELINSITPDVSRNCPVCGAALHGPAFARYEERTYRRCTRCGIIIMNRINPPPIEYTKEYFFEQYQKQYGKTYIEDFPHLKMVGKRRLAVIKSLLPNSTANSNAPPLLDIGCAYGPFLAAAREEGFSPHGIDPAQDAIRYVTQTLGIPAVQGFFPEIGNRDWGLGTGEHDVITLWYVIEHFRDCIPVLAEIKKLLKSGGVLAFATPSFSGISGRACLKRFLEHSPADHWTIWSPAVCSKALKMAGFKVKKIVNSGHHPERFPLLGKFALSRKSPLYGPLLAFSKIFSLGDTFEAYAVSSHTMS